MPWDRRQGGRRRTEWYLLLLFSDTYQVDALDLCGLSFQMKAPAKFLIFALLQFNQKPRYQMNYLCSKSQEGNQKYIWNHYPAGREKNQDWRKESESTLQSKKRRGNSDIWMLETKCSNRFCWAGPGFRTIIKLERIFFFIFSTFCLPE